jgi:hypothetical protein
MKPLLPGITGFYRPPRDTPPPTVDVQALKRACYHVARQTGGTVMQQESSTAAGTCNYHAATIRYPTHSVAVLCNAHYPLIAFTDQLDARFGRIHFIAAPPLAHSFVIEANFIPLDIDYLCAYPEPALLTELYAVEREQLRPWRPEQVGDVIFNHWD